MFPKLILLIPVFFVAACVFPWLAYGALRRAWQKEKKLSLNSGYNGAALATILLRRSGIKGIGVVERGKLFFDNYDPFAGDVNLSEPVYRGKSPAALAHAALYAGQVILHANGDKAFRRLMFWNRILRVTVNMLPAIALALLFMPGGFRLMPVFVGVLVFLMFAQILMLPAFAAAGEQSRKIIHENNLFLPDEIRVFSKALKSVNYRHSAAPLLECFWIRWLF